jgi:hypothetical protein
MVRGFSGRNGSFSVFETSVEDGSGDRSFDGFIGGLA